MSSYPTDVLVAWTEPGENGGPNTRHYAAPAWIAREYHGRLPAEMREIREYPFPGFQESSAVVIGLLMGRRVAWHPHVGRSRESGRIREDRRMTG